MKGNFEKWNKLKQKLNKRKNIPHFKEGQIYYTSIGLNIGFEQNGKGEVFNRPVLIIRKFNKNSFYGVPLTSKTKKGKFYFEFEFIKGKKSYAILSQMKLLDSKRLKTKIGYIDEKLLMKIKDKIKKLI